MQRRRELMGMQSELPSAYRQVEYIQSDGKQLIEVPYIPKFLSTDEFYLPFTATNLAKNVQIIFGTNGWAYGAVVVQMPIVTKKLRCDLKSTSTYIGTLIENEHYQIRYSNDNVIFEGTNTRISEYCRGNPNNLFLFGQGTGQPSTFFVGRIGRTYYKANGIYMFDLIPCIRLNDSVVGMYDIVSHSFLVNIGTGEFIVPA